MANLLSADLDYILQNTEGFWEEIRSKQIFITGGTGFFGCWLLESFAWANDQLNLKAKALVLSRDPEKFKTKVPHLAAHPAIKFQKGDVRNFEFSKEKFSHIIHAAGEASAKLDAEDPLTMLEVMKEGTRHTLDFALSCGAKKFLLTSSGAVYGIQPPEVTHIPENFHPNPGELNRNSAYAEGKRAAESLCATYAKEYGLETKIARCFAFLGPYLPLDIHFAIGNFLRDALNGGPIIIKGDGTPHRSYLYAADLTIWLWTILFNGKSGDPYNVGSEIDMTISEVADIVAGNFSPRPAIQIKQKPDKTKPVERYVPSIEKAKKELGLIQKVMLPEAVKKTAEFFKKYDKLV